MSSIVCLVLLPLDLTHLIEFQYIIQPQGKNYASTSTNIPRVMRIYNCRVASANSQDVNTAISNAQEAFKSGVWSKIPAIQRSVVLSKIARQLEQNIENLANLESMQTGRAVREMKAQLGRLPEWL